MLATSAWRCLQHSRNLEPTFYPSLKLLDARITHPPQTAERIRQKHPDKEWFQLTGLIHDLGKIMAFYDEPQWAVVGDTFPVGCAPRDSIVYGRQSFRDNADIKHPVYSKELGIYEKNCGLDKGRCHSTLQKCSTMDEIIFSGLIWIVPLNVG